jgi:hypothetical protein
VSEDTLAEFALDPDTESPAGGGDGSTACSWVVHEAAYEAAVAQGHAVLTLLMVQLDADGGAAQVRRQASEWDREISHLLGYPAVRVNRFRDAHIALSSRSGYLFVHTSGDFDLAQEAHEAVLDDAIATLPALD